MRPTVSEILILTFYTIRVWLRVPPSAVTIGGIAIPIVVIGTVFLDTADRLYLILYIFVIVLTALYQVIFLWKTDRDDLPSSQAMEDYLRSIARSDSRELQRLRNYTINCVRKLYAGKPEADCFSDDPEVFEKAIHINKNSRAFLNDGIYVPLTKLPLAERIYLPYYLGILRCYRFDYDMEHNRNMHWTTAVSHASIEAKMRVAKHSFVAICVATLEERYRGTDTTKDAT